jgi:predicted naringenin-chalcone synthase
MASPHETRPRISALATAVPDHDIHQEFVGWARNQLASPREQAVFDRMAGRSGIHHRWSVLPASDGSPIGPSGFYPNGAMPGTAARMQLYANAAPTLALAAIAKLPELGAITHLVVASCTGFVAPGVDQILAHRLGLDGSVERTLIGFMGCYAAVTALRTARHIVRSAPAARVLVVTVELSTLHLQPATSLEPLLAMLQFGDGAAAALVTDAGPGLALDTSFAATIDGTADLIRWDVGDTGFAMHLSGEVPGHIATALAGPAFRDALPTHIGGWAVHAGGRSILDAVEGGLNLDPAALAHSRAVLAENGNMSSATLMFVLARLMGDQPATAAALAFGPGLAAEGLTLGWVDA